MPLARWLSALGVTRTRHVDGVRNPELHSATEQFTSYSSHNPTVLPDLAFVDWHSGGVQAIDIADPASPQQAGWFSPTPCRR